MKRIICFSGGHSSALVAIEVARRFGTDDIVLLNHDISSEVESDDIKRFKREVSDHIAVPITYANMQGFEEKNQFRVVMERGAFKVGNGTPICSYHLKTLPFQRWLERNAPVNPNTGKCEGVVVYYGFDRGETTRIQRRSGIMGQMGYRTDYPLALWQRTIESTREVGIDPPNTYSTWKHANCIGCLKAGKQHWYCVWVHRRDLYQQAVDAEDTIGYTILKDQSLSELEPRFAEMYELGIPTDEHMNAMTFWALVKKTMKAKALIDDINDKPCECWV